MTERLADISARIEGIRQLGAVVNAMRGIAAARAQQARGQLVAVDGYATSIAVAIGRALAMLPARRAEPPGAAGRQGLVLFCAEQGFAGAFSERVLDAISAELRSSVVFMIGTRGIAIAAERRIVLGWHCAMPSHSPGVPKLADRIADAVYGRIATGEIAGLDAVFPTWRPAHGIQVERRRLLPFDMKQVPSSKDRQPPLANLEPEVLLAELTTEYVHAEFCEAALHAFAAENEARMAAMTSARSQNRQRLAALQARQRRVRQESITAEIIELSSGEAVGRVSRG